MTVLGLGGTGVIGRQVVAALLRDGQDVRVGSRGGDGVAAAPGVAVDVLTGDGLAEALDGIEVLVDLSHAPSLRRRTAQRFVGEGTLRLLAAAREAHVEHVVGLSVVGIDGVPYPYYEAKVAQERAWASGGLPWSVLRATQVHEFPGQVLATGSMGPLALVPEMRTQPIASSELALALAEVVEAGPSGRVRDLVGPQQESLLDMTRRRVAALGGPRLVVPLRVPGAAGRAMRGGALLGDATARRGHLTYEQWLDDQECSAR